MKRSIAVPMSKWGVSGHGGVGNCRPGCYCFVAANVVYAPVKSKLEISCCVLRKGKYAVICLFKFNIILYHIIVLIKKHIVGAILTHGIFKGRGGLILVSKPLCVFISMSVSKKLAHKA
jgi:hypothetical protein